MNRLVQGVTQFFHLEIPTGPSTFSRKLLPEVVLNFLKPCDRYLNNRTSSLDYKPSEGETLLMQDCILNMSEWYKHVFANE